MKSGLPKTTASPFDSFNFHASVDADGQNTMLDDTSVLQALGQDSSEEAGTIFLDFLRGSVREMISDVNAAEAEDLCRPKQSRTGGNVFRSGSGCGRVLIDGQREPVTRPRVWLMARRPNFL